MQVDRRPTALALKTWLCIVSVPYMFGLNLPPSLSAGPDVFGYAAVWTLGIGAIVSLVGLIWRGDPLNGLVLEQVGLIGITLGLTLYVIALFTFTTVTRNRVGEVGLAAGLAVAIVAGAVWQYAEIRKYRRDKLTPANGHGHQHG